MQVAEPTSLIGPAHPCWPGSPLLAWPMSGGPAHPCWPCPCLLGWPGSPLLAWPMSAGLAHVCWPGAHPCWPGPCLLARGSPLLAWPMSAGPGLTPAGLAHMSAWLAWLSHPFAWLITQRGSSLGQVHPVRPGWLVMWPGPPLDPVRRPDTQSPL